MEFPSDVNKAIQQLVSDLSRDDEMGSVVRAHIRLERLLFAVIERLTPHPAHLRKLELDYDKSVTLALALGLDERLGPPLRALGKLRNDFAHKADFSLSKQAVTNVYSALHSDTKTLLQASFEHSKQQGEPVRQVLRFSELEPKAQFDLIAVTIWSSVQAELLLHSAKDGSS